MIPASNTLASRCAPKGRSVALPILAAGGTALQGGAGSHTTIKPSRSAKWRAAVLIVVHLIIAAHIIQWLVTGSTVTPVEPSESMETIRNGVINAGFIFFTLAIVSTLILGRFFCGWGCHIVALQDLCSWLMGRVGVKPKPFRSRLLVWVPLIVALYMFVWPAFHRDILRPVLMDDFGNLPAWLGQSEPLDALRAEFITRDFWATFAPWYIAIPFIFICTFGAVYFLGSKGFCTYGCPYGGIFGPADIVAPGRIRVTDACEGCGHCTAVCTSNVRVHEEVRDFGMVVDPGCMKCMDCVSVCPKEALYFGFGRPALRAKPRTPARLSEDQARAARAKAKADRAARYDLYRWEEWAIAGLFLAFFLAYRGLANSVPMLMAVGIAGIAAFSTWKLWSLFSKPSVRLQSLQLKAKGRMRPVGYGFAIFTLTIIIVGVWSGYVRYHLWRADMLYGHLDIPHAVLLRPDFEASPAAAATARAALAHFRRASPPTGFGGTALQSGVGGSGGGGGGVGWPLQADQKLTIAYLHSVLGEFDHVERLLREVIREGKPRDPLVSQVAQLIQRRASLGSTDLAAGAGAEAEKEILDLYSDALARHPALDGIRSELSAWHLTNNRREEADALWNQIVGTGETAEIGPGKRHATPGTLLGAARFHAGAGSRQRALALLDRAVEDRHADAQVFLAAAGLAAQLGERQRALDLAMRATEFPTRRGGTLIAAAGLFLQLEDVAGAAEKAGAAVQRARDLGPHTARLSTFVGAAMLEFQIGRAGKAKELLAEAAASAGPAPWALSEIAGVLMGYSNQSGDAQAAQLAVDLLLRARDIRPDATPIRVDLAGALFAIGRTDEAVAQMEAAAEMSRANVVIPAIHAGLLRQVGRAEEAARWEAEAARRAAPASPK